MKNAVFCEVTSFALVGTDVSEERITSVNIVTRFSELGATLTITTNRSTLRSISSSQHVSVPSYCKRCSQLDYSFHSSDTSLRNVGSYISHTA
jgi:hypothetical protein